MKYIVIKYFDDMIVNIFVFDNCEEAKKYYEEVKVPYKGSMIVHFKFKEVPNDSKILEHKLVVIKKIKLEEK